MGDCGTCIGIPCCSATAPSVKNRIAQRATEIGNQQNVLPILSPHPQRHDRNDAALFRLLPQDPPD